MAIAPTTPFVTVEEYLNTSYPNGDREYLDGVVVERNLGTHSHGSLQAILAEHLRPFRKTGQFGVIIDCRTRITSSRFRVPDVALVPEPYDRKARFCAGAPLVVIEVLSPEDRVKDTMRRFSDYEALGVRFILEMDPDERITYIYKSGSLIREELTQLDIGPEPIPFDTQALYAKIDD